MPWPELFSLLHHPTAVLTSQQSVSDQVKMIFSFGSAIVIASFAGSVVPQQIAQDPGIVFNIANGTVNVLARDPRLVWVDTFAVATDGYIYFTKNQLWRTRMFYPGTDRRVKPYVLFRAKLPGNGTKVDLK